MSSDPEARFRAALVELGDAFLELAGQPHAQPPAEGRVELLSVADAAKRIGVARSTAYLLVSDGSLRSVKLRGRRLVPSTEVDRLAREGGR